MINPQFLALLYLTAGALFIFSLGGLSKQESARRGFFMGVLGMVVAIAATMLNGQVSEFKTLIPILLIGVLLGVFIASKVKMTQMPELIAILHSFVGMAAVLIGVMSYLDPEVNKVGADKVIHEIEIFIGVFIGIFTFTGSAVAFGKLSTLIGGKPLVIPLRHWINLILLLSCIYLGVSYVNAETHQQGLIPLLMMCLFAGILGIHLVMSIGGGDMPIVISMLNSYSGWAAAATGFMLSNVALIIVGALVGSSGAILSYIMCRAINRNFISVILGGFGASKKKSSGGDETGEIIETNVNEVAALLLNATSVIIVPGYGMAVAQAQSMVSQITKKLSAKGITVRFGIHPVAGRLPGHMNVLLAEASVPYDIVLEMDELNDDFINTDVCLVIGANDIVNPSSLEDPDSPIAGMPVLRVWQAENCIVLKRGMATGYAGISNPLFYKEHTSMLFGDANDSLARLYQALGDS